MVGDLLIVRLLLTFVVMQKSFCVYCSDNEATTAIIDLSATPREAEHSKKLQLWLTISARFRFVEISWQNAPACAGDIIMLTTQEPHHFERHELVADTARGLAPLDVSAERSVAAVEGSDSGATIHSLSSTTKLKPQHLTWISNGGQNDIIVAIHPSASAQWYTTGVPFDYTLSQNVTATTNCYGYWASYVSEGGDILATNCLRAYPRWMNDMRSTVGCMRMRDLFLVGTHDSGSYIPNFDPLRNETLVTKYALTQDENFHSQLLHGARYLDIRVGYYRKTSQKFFINHGVTRHRPLLEAIEQVKQFVAQTNEIVIFGLKEFPIGFGRKLDVHRLLAQYLQKHFGNFVVHPRATWQATLDDIWSRQQNVILAYDNRAIVEEFQHLLFWSVEQRWGNVQNWSRLETHLRRINKLDPARISSRPVADMAELTPDTWGVIFDKYGGLRKMADNTNWRISQLYRDELGANTNIVAVDFVRGTNLMEISIYWNKRKVPYVY